MAFCYPDFETINSLKVKPTEGELHLLRFLISTLDDTYEIYFQPYLNMDRPDIVIMRKNSGVLIIEVKDWDLESYDIVNKNTWRIKSNGVQISSPFKQVLDYKDNIFNLHVDDLVQMKIHNSRLYSIISCAVYFHKSNQQEIKNKIIDAYSKSAENCSWLNFLDIITPDNLNQETLKELLNKRRLDKDNLLFTEHIYNSLRRHLKPPFHTYEEGKEISYSPEQNELIISKPGSQKIKGVAGCGKTLVLAKRAVNAYKRTKKKVLILSFNISLRNYIHDRISDVREDFEWPNFEIIHYHQFILANANNYNLSLSNGDLFSDVDLFEIVKDSILKYDAIFIDEGQDYQYEWFVVLKNYFLADDGEFVICADEKQNIYQNTLEPDKTIRTNIPGAWNRSLNKSFRLSKDISFLASEYQKRFWTDKYELDPIQSINKQQDLFSKQLIQYKYFDKITTESLMNFINEKSTQFGIHPDDIAILGPEIESLRNLDHLIRHKLHLKTKVMFEDYETYQKLFEELKGKNEWLFLRTLHDIQRSKKFNFVMNPGTMKLSTIHSFKGWEIDTIFLLIHGTNSAAALEELVYTGLTRARNKLFIINLGQPLFDDFFKNVFKMSNIKMHKEE